MNKPNNQSTLDIWVDWLLHLHAQEIDLGLKRIQLVAESMQLLRPAPVVITVAGTNGKGSSVAMLSSILKEAGYRVGTYTSPHIVSFVERIQINGNPVSEQEIVDAFSLIEDSRAETKLTYFEFSTLAALQIFKQSKLDVVVLEVGLGGRLDAVNVVDADASLVTAIDIDHIEWLGDDRSVIATEKAGIMRPQQISVCSDPDVPASLIDYASDLGVNLKVLNQDYFYQPEINGWALKSEKNHYQYYLPALKGNFQLQNAAGVVMLLKQVSLYSNLITVNDEQINAGLEAVKHPGRLEQRLIDGQSWLIDVAHNPQSAQVLAEFLQQHEMQQMVAVFSALNDKDMVPMVKALSSYIKEWHVADLNIPRSSDLNTLKKVLEQAGVSGSSVFVHPSIGQAVDAVKQHKANNVLAWGSFFTVAQVLTELQEANQ